MKHYTSFQSITQGVGFAVVFCVHVYLRAFLLLTLCGSILHSVFVFTRPMGTAAVKAFFHWKPGKGVLDMARYRVNYTIYKDPTGKTLKGPSFVHFLGDLCSGFGLFGILGVILAFMEDYGPPAVAASAVLAVVGFALMAVFHKQAKKSAEAKCLKVLAQQEGRFTTEKKG